MYHGRARTVPLGTRLHRREGYSISSEAPCSCPPCSWCSSPPPRRRFPGVCGPGRSFPSWEVPRPRARPSRHHRSFDRVALPVVPEPFWASRGTSAESPTFASIMAFMFSISALLRAIYDCASCRTRAIGALEDSLGHRYCSLVVRDHQPHEQHSATSGATLLNRSISSGEAMPGMGPPWGAPSRPWRARHR